MVLRVIAIPIGFLLVIEGECPEALDERNYGVK
jgi:hypothetical protein